MHLYNGDISVMLYKLGLFQKYITLYEFISYSLIQSLFSYWIITPFLQLQHVPLEKSFSSPTAGITSPTVTQMLPLSLLYPVRDLPSDLYASYLITTVCLPCLLTLNPAGTTKWLRQFLLKFSTTSLCDFLHHGLAVWRRFVNDLSMRQCGVFQALDTTCPCKKGPQNPV